MCNKHDPESQQMDPGAFGGQELCPAQPAGKEHSFSLDSILTQAMSKSHYNLVVFLVAGVGKSQF